MHYSPVRNYQLIEMSSLLSRLLPLPEGEGMAPIIELHEFMSLISSITLFVVIARLLQYIKTMLTGQQ
jgi:hypothetical protein